MSTNVEKVARSVDSWWKIISVIVALILLVYNVSAVWIKLVDAESRMEEIEHNVERENQIRDERSDARYKEALNMYKELRDHGIRLTEDYQKHLVDDAYQRGRVDAKLENLEKR